MQYYHVGAYSVDVDGDCTTGYQQDYYVGIPEEFTESMQYIPDESNDDGIFAELLDIAIARKQRVVFVPPRTWLLELRSLVERRDDDLIREHYERLLSMLKQVDRNRPVCVALEAVLNPDQIVC